MRAEQAHTEELAAERSALAARHAKELGPWLKDSDAINPWILFNEFI